MRKFFKPALFILTIFILFPLQCFAKDDVTVLLLYASWHSDTHGIQTVMQKLIDSYGGNVDYFLCNVEDPDSCRYVKKHRINIPQKIPSVMVFVDDKLVFEKFYEQDKMEELVKPLNSLILSFI